MNNEKSPEQIREESDAARETARVAGVAAGAIPAVEPTRIVHGHPAQLANADVEALPSADAPPPAAIVGDQPGDTGSDSLGDWQVGEDGVRRYSGSTQAEPAFETINGHQDRAPLDGPATFVALGRNSEGSYGELSSDFPFTDETTDGKVLRNDGAIVERQPLTGIADANQAVAGDRNPYYEGTFDGETEEEAAARRASVGATSTTAADPVTDVEQLKGEDPAPEATYAGESTPVEASAPATDEGQAGVAPDGERVADVATDGSITSEDGASARESAEDLREQAASDAVLVGSEVPFPSADQQQANAAHWDAAQAEQSNADAAAVEADQAEDPDADRKNGDA